MKLAQYIEQLTVAEKTVKEGSVEHYGIVGILRLWDEGKLIEVSQGNPIADKRTEQTQSSELKGLNAWLNIDRDRRSFRVIPGKDEQGICFQATCYISDPNNYSTKPFMAFKSGEWEKTITKALKSLEQKLMTEGKAVSDAGRYVIAD